MSKMTAEQARKLDWSQFPDSRPREGVVYPQGDHKANLIARIRAALQRVKIKQVA